MPWQRKEVPEVGVACLVYLIHTEMDAIFQPIKKSDTYQIKLLTDDMEQKGYICEIWWKLYVCELRYLALSGIGLQWFI